MRMHALTLAQLVERARIVTLSMHVIQSYVGQIRPSIGGGSVTQAMPEEPSVSFMGPHAQDSPRAATATPQVGGLKLEMLE